MNSSQYFLLQLVLLGFIFGIGMLTKQLLIFSLIPLSFLVFNLIFIASCRERLKAIIYSIAFVSSITLPIIILDNWLVLPQEYFSHLERIILACSEHMDKISGNGFNIWMLLNRDMWSSSKIPFIYSLTPKLMGVIIFLVNFCFLTIIFVLKNSSYKCNSHKKLIFNSIFFTALINLSFNLFLSGTHERYLYYFYPLILIFLASTYNSKRLLFKQPLNLSLAIIGNVLYGCFVLMILVGFSYQQSHISMFIFHFIFYLILVASFCKQLNSSVSIIPRIKLYLTNNNP